MSDLLYIDLLIENGNFVLNTGKEPELCNNRKSIGQDIIHSILESGLATQLIGERSPTLRADIFTQLELLIEEDERIVPGTVEVSEENQKRLWVTASTYDYADWREIVNDLPGFDVPALQEVLAAHGYRNCFLHAGYWNWRNGEEFLKARQAETIVDARHLRGGQANSWGSSDRTMLQAALA